MYVDCRPPVPVAKRRWCSGAECVAGTHFSLCSISRDSFTSLNHRANGPILPSPTFQRQDFSFRVPHFQFYAQAVLPPRRRVKRRASVHSRRLTQPFTFVYRCREEYKKLGGFTFSMRVDFNFLSSFAFILFTFFRTVCSRLKESLSFSSRERWKMVKRRIDICIDISIKFPSRDLNEGNKSKSEVSCF